MMLRIGILLVLTVALLTVAVSATPQKTQAEGVSVDRSFPLWGLVLSGGSLAAAWGVAMFRINTFAKYHKEHYAHADDDDKHWTRRERDALTQSIRDLHDDVKKIKP